MSKQEAWKCDGCGELMQSQEVNVPQDVRFASGVVIKAGDYHPRCFARLAGGQSVTVSRKVAYYDKYDQPVFADEIVRGSERNPSPEPSYNDDPYPVPTGRGVGPSGPLLPPSLPASRGVRVARKLATR